jgi:antitoxin (DNA-binding transcriptional repressor) of toxin-antitoxin stability system
MDRRSAVTIVKMRDLLRNPTEVFDTLKPGDDPVLITRKGEPVALLSPVAPADAASAALAALPEFAERRRQADQAVREGRMVRSAEVLSRLRAQPGAETLAPEEEAVRTLQGAFERLAERDWDPVTERITLLFGSDTAEKRAERVRLMVAEGAAPVLNVVVGAETARRKSSAEEVAERVSSLSGWLFSNLLQRTWRQAFEQMDPALTLTGQVAAADAHEALAEKILERANAATAALNMEAARGLFEGAPLDLPRYRAFVAGVGAFDAASEVSGTLDMMAGPEPSATDQSADTPSSLGESAGSGLPAQNDS